MRSAARKTGRACRCSVASKRPATWPGLAGVETSERTLVEMLQKLARYVSADLNIQWLNGSLSGNGPSERTASPHRQHRVRLSGKRGSRRRRGHARRRFKTLFQTLNSAADTYASVLAPTSNARKKRSSVIFCSLNVARSCRSASPSACVIRCSGTVRLPRMLKWAAGDCVVARALEFQI